MNAVKMLKQQHREVEKLFKSFEAAKSADRRRKVFEELADKLAVHATIEEQPYYPAVKANRTPRTSCSSRSRSTSQSSVSSPTRWHSARRRRRNLRRQKIKFLKEDGRAPRRGGRRATSSRRSRSSSTARSSRRSARAMEETEKELKSEGNPRDAVPGETDAAAPV